jgi:hypothetical protein
VYCGQCGTHNHEEAGHCETCGAPLLISAGARSCGNCGALLGDNDRYCTSCGASATAALPQERYDAADDFGELDIDDIQIDDLPDWLQGMAPQHSQAPPPSPDHPSPDDLPDWLRESPSAPARESAYASDLPRAAAQPQQEQGNLDHQPANEFSLVSDDDLPDWLKALSDEADETDMPAPATEPVTAAAGPSQQQTMAVANLFDVPPVSRAWHSQGRFVDQNQVTAARQEFSPLEVLSVIQSEQAGTQSIWETSPMDVSGDNQSTSPFAVAEEGAGSTRGKLIIRVVILVLLVLIALTLAYVLLQ